MSEYVDFHYMPLEGKITGKQVLKQTEDAINDLGNKVYNLDIDEGRIDEAIEKSDEAINTADAALAAVTTDRAIWKNTVAEMQATNIDLGVTAATRGKMVFNDGNGAFYGVRSEKSGDVESDDTVFLDNGNVAERIQSMNIIAKGNNIIFVTNVAELIDSDALVGNVYGTTGYYSADDGGAGVYTIRTKTQSDVDDGGSIIFLDNGNVAELITGGKINVKQFGAKGDGITDDREAFQKAFTASANVYVPKGTYKIVNATGNGADIFEQRADAVANNTLYPLVFTYDNGSIIIDGTIYGASALGDVLQITGKNVQISGNGIIKGSGVTNDTNSGDITQQWKAALINLGGMNDSVEGLTFDTPHTISIYANGKHQRVYNCNFVGGVESHGTGTVYFHVAAQSPNGEGLVVFGNSFLPDNDNKSVYSFVYSYGSPITVVNNVFGYALEHAIYNYGTQTLIKNNRFGATRLGCIQSFAENCIIADNEFFGLAGIQIMHASGTMIKGNIFKLDDDGETYTGNLIYIAVRDYHDTNYVTKNIKILDNIFDLPLVGETISFRTAYGFEDIDISGNTIKASRTTTTLFSSNYSGAICVSSSDNTKPNQNINIKNNTVRNSSFYGIFLWETKNCEIAGNKIFDGCIIPDYAATGCYIVIQGANKNVKVHHNLFEDTKQTHTLASPLYIVTQDDTVACDNTAIGVVPPNGGLSYSFMPNVKPYGNIRNSINNAVYCGVHTSTTAIQVTIDNAMAQSYNGFQVKLTPLDAKAHTQQASQYALYGTASYGKIYLTTSNNQTPPSDTAGGTFLWEIFK